MRRSAGRGRRDVTFHVCDNPRVGREISYETDLFEAWGDDTVPSGVAP
jgi:hypothetical protein